MRIQDFNKTHGSLQSISMRMKHWMKILLKFRTKEAEIKRDLIIISIDVNLYIENIESPPFDNERIEKIRSKMAKTGNFKLARTSNKI
jgi:hypothetical protein